MWKGWRRAAGYCWTMWISWCTSFTRSCGSFISSSGCGATLLSSPRATAEETRRDSVGDVFGVLGAHGTAARCAILRSEQGAVPQLQVPIDSDRTLRHLLLPG